MKDFIKRKKRQKLSKMLYVSHTSYNPWNNAKHFALNIIWQIKRPWNKIKKRKGDYENVHDKINSILLTDTNKTND